MKKDLRIVFMGTPEFAVAGLHNLVISGYAIVGVVTAPDKPAGRGRKIHESAVKKYAVEHNLNLLQPTNLKSTSFVEELETLQPNLQIVVAFRMLPKVVWQLPEFGTFNLHASLLPQYRGAAPINWALINGEKTTGATTFFIDEKIDTGAIILQNEMTINPEDHAGSLHDKLMDLGAKLILETVAHIENGTVTTYKQTDPAVIKAAPKIFKHDCKVDWSLPGNSIFNFVRGLSPYPTAWTTLRNGPKDITIKIFEVAFEQARHQMDIGTVQKSKVGVTIAVGDGFIRLLTVQFPGKRKMAIKELLNGLNLEEEARVL
ncbi:MAG: methionyl-tRNA formyltransferase [Bacteroidota bacterium]